MTQPLRLKDEVVDFEAISNAFDGDSAAPRYYYLIDSNSHVNKFAWVNLVSTVSDDQTKAERFYTEAAAVARCSMIKPFHKWHTLKIWRIDSSLGLIKIVDVSDTRRSEFNLHFMHEVIRTFAIYCCLDPAMAYEMRKRVVDVIDSCIKTKPIEELEIFQQEAIAAAAGFLVKMKGLRGHAERPYVRRLRYAFAVKFLGQLDKIVRERAT